MKRNIKRIVALFGVVLTVVCSVAPSYYVYADGEISQDETSQEVTSDDNIVQKLFYYSMSAIGALNKTSNALTGLPTTISNNVKETIASLMNGGGIYVDENGDYVFTDEACNFIYQALNNNSSIDANVVSNFSNFSYIADGYVNSDYLLGCNQLTSFYNISGSGSLDGVNDSNGVSGDYLLMCYRYTDGDRIGTSLVAYDVGNVAYISVYRNNSNIYLSFYNSSGTKISVPFGYNICCFFSNENNYKNFTFQYVGTLDHLRGYYIQKNNSGQYIYKYQDLLIYPANNDSINSVFNAFPTFNDASGCIRINGTLSNLYFYCNKSIIIAKDSVGANSILYQTEGVFYQSFENKIVNNTVLENNNWENIYNSYIQNVNIDYQNDPSMSTSDFRKIMKKYTGSVIDAIENGSSNIEESISISNRYLQAISVDVRNISEKLDDMTSGGSGGGITPEQYNSIMGKLDNINDNAIDIASSTATISSDIDAIWEDTQSMSSDLILLVENTGDTNTNLVAIDTLLQQINNKLRNRRTDNPLPDPDFWDNLDDELDDYTNTMMEDLIFKLQMIGTVLQGVVPFGYLAVLNVMVNALAEEPEAPVFEIDLQSNGATAIPVDWQGTIDLSWVDDIMPIVRSFEVILFIIGLIWATFSVFTSLGSLL